MLDLLGRKLVVDAVHVQELQTGLGDVDGFVLGRRLPVEQLHGALVRAGLLGKVVEVGEDRWKATWPDADGIEQEAELGSEREAVVHVARNAEDGLRFHDLRHSYATWMVSDGSRSTTCRR